jgi:hypothetical protein
MQPLMQRQNLTGVMTDLASSSGLEPFDSILLAFDPPVGFQAIQGHLRGDEFLSDVFRLDKYKVGFIRIPSMQPIAL